MSRVLVVAWRDFKQTVLTRAFLFAVVGVPLIIIALVAVAVLILIGHESPPLVGTVGIVDPTGEVLAAARIELDSERLTRDRDMARPDATDMITGGGGPSPLTGTMTTTPGLGRGDIDLEVEEVQGIGDDGLPDGLRERLRDGRLLAVAVISPDLLETPDDDTRERPRFDLYVGEDVDADHIGVIEGGLGQAVVRARARRVGLDADTAMAMLARPKSNTSRLLKSGGEASESENIRKLKQIIPVVFMMLLWGSTISSGQHLMTSTIEEKSNKVMEVLLSAVSPLQLMTGKIIGQGAVGLIIVGVYSSLGLAGIVVAASAHLIAPMLLVYLAVYFFMAYFMVAALMAAVGSAVSDIREANSLMMPVMIILMAPLILWMPISQDPNGTVATAFSFIPPAIPFVMILRVTSDEGVPWWQILITIGWGYLCVLWMIWTAAKIFRVGVLMTGKPPNPIELIRWIRYS